MAHTHNHTNVSGSKLFWTIIFNSIITVAEFIGGIMSGYLALVADAVHNLSDVAALILAWLGVKGSELPPTKKSTYGFMRIEVMTAFISAAALVVIAIFIIMEAYDRLLEPQPITKPWLFLSIAIIGLFGNILSIWLLNSEKGKSLNMKTAFLHMAYDAISSVVVIIGGIAIILTEIYIIDVILATVIALMIFWSSYLVIKEAVLIFLEAVPDNINYDQVQNAIREIDKVNNVHDLHIWSLSSKEVALSCHVSIDNTFLNSSPDIINDINKMLNDKFHIGHSTIQVETVDCPHPDSICNHNNHGEEFES
jgi:cobalt-zinc-cadmium efflux system protein